MFTRILWLTEVLRVCISLFFQSGEDHIVQHKADLKEIVLFAFKNCKTAAAKKVIFSAF